MIIQPISASVSLSTVYVPSPGNISKLQLDEKINWLKQAIELEKRSEDDSTTQATVVQNIQKVIEQLKLKAQHVEPQVDAKNQTKSNISLKPAEDVSITEGYTNYLLNAKV